MFIIKTKKRCYAREISVLSKNLNNLSSFHCVSKADLIIFALTRPNIVKNLKNLNKMSTKITLKSRAIIIFATLLSLYSTRTMADNWDTYADTWVAVDGLGREIYSSTSKPTNLMPMGRP